MRRCGRRQAADSGAPASYIPELASAEPDQLAFAVVGPRGHVRSVGDDEWSSRSSRSRSPSSSRSCSSDLGLDAVMKRVGTEPSGEPFNAISLEEDSGRPANPMVNAGAIATTGLVRAPTSRSARGRSSTLLSGFAGRALHVDESVYRSESTTGDRNRALAHLMRSYGIVDAPVDFALETVLPAVLDPGDRPRPRRDGERLSPSAASTRSRVSASSPSGWRATSCRSCRAAACTTSPASGSCGSGCRRRAASAAVCSPSLRRSSASPLSARAWIGTATACAVSEIVTDALGTDGHASAGAAREHLAADRRHRRDRATDG